MSDDVEFLIDAKASIFKEASEDAKREQAVIEQPPKPNSIVIKLWNGSHVSFEPENSVQIFSILALGMLAVTCILIGFFGIFVNHQAAWPEKAFTVLGSAISAIVGAMVGSSAVASRSKRK
jgi:hypothetical protein